MVAKHNIKHTVIDFNYNGKTDGFALQHEVKEWTDDFLMDLDKQFAEASPGDTFLSIDELVLDVNVGVLNWQKEANIQIAKQLKDKLRLLRSGIKDAGNLQIKNSVQQFEELFLHFIQNGFLPWQASTLEKEDWERGLQMVIDDTRPKLVDALIQLFKRSVLAVQRFCNTVLPETALKMFAPFIQQHAGASAAFIQDIETLVSQKNILKNKSFIHAAYQEWLLFIASGNNVASAKQTTIANIAFHAKNHPVVLESLLGAPFKSEEWQAWQHDFLIDKEELYKQTQQVTDTKEENFQERNLSGEKVIGKDIKGKKQKFNETFTSATEGIYISNAGLVLVASFLPVFFERMKLSENQMITDADRAVCLVNYLATGNVQMKEYELVIPKILCGLQPNSVVDTHVAFSDEDLKEANELLVSVIEHWSILKDASVDALRQTFLVRDGKLSFNNNEWKLQVAKAQFDMLLDHLPWNISMIKLGWMNELLTTEWM